MLQIIIPVGFTVVGYFIFRGIKKKTKGKKLIVLGKTGTGKSSLVQAFAEGTIPKGHVNLAGVRTFVPKINAKELGLELSEEPIEDFPGVNEFRKIWQEKLPEKDLIIYLFRADHLLDNEKNGKRIRADIMSDIPHILAKKKRGAFFCIVGTHLDLLHNFTFGKYEDHRSFEEHKNVRDLLSLAETSYFCAGKLNEEKLAKDLVRSIVCYIDNHYSDK